LKKLLLLLLQSCLLLFAGPFPLSSQTVSSNALTLNKAVEAAANNYPSIRAAQAKAASSNAGIDVARTTYLPKTDLIWQENRATRNNVFGLLLPQSVIPSISGPVLGTNDSTNAWGSVGGLLFTWEPFDFGLRKANVNLARALNTQDQAGIAVTRLDVEASAVDAFLGVLAADQAVRAAQANVERLGVFAKSVQVLVQNQLRPGIDSSSAEAELASARNVLIQAQQNAVIARVSLGELTGVPAPDLLLESGPLLDLPADATTPALNLETHPVAIAQTAAVTVAQTREQIVDRSYYPKFSLQSAFYARGTGNLLNGQVDNGKGFYPQIYNWATGVSITFPLLDIFTIRARRRVEANNTIAERARFDQTIQTLKAQDARARALIDGARKIAANTPVQLKAAQETEVRARARYAAELTTVVEVAEAQRLLTQAEIDDAIARLNVWRAMLIAARARGDLEPFLQQVATASAQRSK
jgi:outer membrane protein TolC